MVPSSDLMGSGSNRRHIQNIAHLYADGDMSAIIDHMFETACPEEYAKEKKAYKAGHWLGEETMDLGGLHWKGAIPHNRTGWALNKVTLYKLHTGLHRDVHDSWCCALSSGRFTGGEGLFPDLGLKLRYVLLSFSSCHYFIAKIIYLVIPKAM